MDNKPFSRVPVSSQGERPPASPREDDVEEVE